MHSDYKNQQEDTLMLRRMLLEVLGSMDGVHKGEKQLPRQLLNYRANRMFRLVCRISLPTLLLTLILVGSSSAQTYSGQATAARVRNTIVGQPAVTVAVADTGDLPNAGGNITLASIGVNLSPVATVGSSTSTTQGGGSLSQSTSSINNVNIGVLSNVITADVVSSTTSASCPGQVLSGNSVITNLQINGGTVVVNGTPNQTVQVFLLGDLIGTLVINERIVGSREITANALHLFVTDPISLTTTDVVIASARSGINCVGAPPFNIYSGRGTGVRFNQFDVLFGDVTTLISDTGPLPGSGGNINVTTVGAGILPPVLTSGTVTSSTSGGIPGGNANTSQSASSVENLGINLLAGAVTLNATVLSSNTQCTCGLGIPTCTADSLVTGLAVNVLGLPVTVDVLGTPNQVVNIPVLGLGSITLTLNGRQSAGAGDITAFPLRIQTSLLGLIATDITIARSHSDIVCGIVPSAASVTVAGRVFDRYGRGAGRVMVSIIDSKGKVTTAVTNSFGNYRFSGIGAGETYVIAPSARGATYKPEVLWIGDDITGLDFYPSD